MIAIIKYNAGNVTSVQNAFDRLGYTSEITDNHKKISAASHVVIPGVGHASSAMQDLKMRNLDKLIPQLKQPVLGICLGLHVMCQHSEEGDVNCLGIFNANVKKFPSTDIVPHMGWNNFTTVKGSLLNDMAPEDHMYYVHNYYAEISSNTSASCEYIVPFSACLQRNNFFACQFHPEKSSSSGEQLLTNFLNTRIS